MARLFRILLTFIMGSALFIALPILVWGVGDIPGFFANSARVSFVFMAAVLNGFAAVRHPELGNSARAPKTTVKRQHRAVLLLQLLSVLIVVVAPFSDRHRLALISDGELVRYIGLIFYILGFLTMHFAQTSLGTQFSLEVSIQESHALITTGLYRYLRHPRYLGIVVFSVGISMVFQSWFAIVASMATMLVLLWRIRDEELLMSKEFGARWQAYCSKSWRLVPFIF